MYVGDATRFKAVCFPQALIRRPTTKATARPSAPAAALTNTRRFKHELKIHLYYVVFNKNTL